MYWQNNYYRAKLTSDGKDYYITFKSGSEYVNIKYIDGRTVTPLEIITTSENEPYQVKYRDSYDGKTKVDGFADVVLMIYSIKNVTDYLVESENFIPKGKSSSLPTKPKNKGSLTTCLIIGGILIAGIWYWNKKKN